jgi:hypothetical protein
MKLFTCLAFILLMPVSAALASQVTSSPAATPLKEAPLSNADVVKLSKLQLGDEVVLAKIKQAGAVNFDLTTDGLGGLKQAGVSSRVIAAMLERTTAKASPVSGATSGHSSGGDVGNGSHAVSLLINDEEVRLPSSRGDLSAVGFWPVVMTFLDYPGLHARVRITNIRPTLIIRSEHDPKGYYYLGRLDVNDEDDNNRSLKIEQKAGAFSATARIVPAGRWHVEYDASEASPGVWQITPNRDLQPGEYGVVVPGGILYEFGVD